MLTKRRARMIQMQTAIEQQAYRIEASRRGAIAVLAFFASVGFLAGYFLGEVAK